MDSIATTTAERLLELGLAGIVILGLVIAVITLWRRVIKLSDRAQTNIEGMFATARALDRLTDRLDRLR